MTNVLHVDGVTAKLNYGVNKVRFPAPVPVGCKVRAGVELVAPISRSRIGVQALTRVTIDIEARQARLRRRPGWVSAMARPSSTPRHRDRQRHTAMARGLPLALATFLSTGARPARARSPRA